jgi:S1-C subfamily serine protease
MKLRWFAALLCLRICWPLTAMGKETPCPAVAEKDRPILATSQLEKIAQSITVRVISPAVVGSGVIVGRQGSQYQVLTNAHNLLGTDRTQVQTGDGSSHLARRSPRQSWGKKDVALIEFQSDRTYQVAEWSPQVATKGLEIVSAGFEFDRQEVTVSKGQVSQFLENPMRSGYQLGYSSRLQQGMSGGPILDRSGLLLGINAMAAYPILNRAYVFADGSRPSPPAIKQLRRSNWGIPLRNANGCLRLNYSPTFD